MDSLIGLSSVSFPASVALLIVLFFALILCETTLGDKRTRKIVHIIDIPVSCAKLSELGKNDSLIIRLGLRYAISTSFLRLHSVSALISD